MWGGRRVLAKRLGQNLTKISLKQNRLQLPSPEIQEFAAHRSQQAAIHHAPKQTMASVSLTSYLSVPFCEHIFIIFSEMLFYFKSPVQSTSLFSLPTGHFFEKKRLSPRKQPFPSFSKYCSYCIKSHIPLTARKHSLFKKHHRCTFLKLHDSLKNNKKKIHVPTRMPSTIDPKNEDEGFKPSEFYFWFTYSTFNNTVKLGNLISYFVFWN